MAEGFRVASHGHCGTVPPREKPLTVAVTGPTGTFGFGLMPLLESDARIGRVVGIARRPFDPAERGWSKLEYVQGDVRDREALEAAFAGADVVVHLAFMITGTAARSEIRAINVDGTLNAFDAAVAAGAGRFVYASSVAAYGFHRDNPVGMTEDWPARPADHLFYAQEKAEIEAALTERAEDTADCELFMLRPPIVLGPNAVGAKNLLPGPLEPAAGKVAGLVTRLPVSIPVPVPDLPMQFIHETDVATALRLCIVGAGPAGVYNIAGEGVLSAAEVAEEIGLRPLPVPGAPVQAIARAVAGIPGLPPVAEWAEAASHPAIMDSAKAKRDLGWMPRYSGLEALRDTLHS